ncbi:MAG: hypothetical protein KatS3mg114_1044 [Planctomycetaceae bacterium]|nr:MAG: hypothetical protein KatS3mg114_1044 [Planctomycetaceae bacterium]
MLGWLPRFVATVELVVIVWGGVTTALWAQEMDEFEVTLPQGVPSAVAEVTAAVSTRDRELFGPEQLLAWCIVPFDAARRGPRERVAKLRELGFRRFAYDWRAEHLDSFEEELRCLQEAGIELTAVWFPLEWNHEAEHLSAVLKKYGCQTQWWVTGGGDPVRSPEEHRARIASEVARLRPIVEAAARQGCRIGLYNHGGWFGDPRHQLELIQALQADHVGLVFNLHHAHELWTDLPNLLPLMLPHLLCFNLNGMEPAGDRQGRKILPIGVGSEDQVWLKLLRDSGYGGPIGILGHTADDASERLTDNLWGLRWLLQQPSQPPWTRFPPLLTYSPPQADRSSSVMMLPIDARQYRDWQMEWRHTIRRRTQELMTDPNQPRAWLARGDAWFLLGDFARAVADYDRMIRLDPAWKPRHWQRGLALFFAQRYAESAAQFTWYHEQDQVDRENGIWRYLAMTCLEGEAKARSTLLRYDQDDRPPLPLLYRMFAGELTPEQVLSEVRQRPRDASSEAVWFYTRLYLGCFYWVRGEAAAAYEHLDQALRITWPLHAGYGPRMMWHVARLLAMQPVPRHPHTRPPEATSPSR